MRTTKNQNLLNFVETVGSFIEYWGFKKVHGRIWALTFLSPEPVDANYLKSVLGISKALTSMSIKELLEYEVLLEVRKSRPETQKYQANPDITEVILNVLKERELVLLKKVDQSFKKIKNSHQIHNNNICPSRLDEMDTMIQTARSILTTIVGLGKVDFKEIDESFRFET